VNSQWFSELSGFRADGSAASAFARATRTRAGDLLRRILLARAGARFEYFVVAGKLATGACAIDDPPLER